MKGISRPQLSVLLLMYKQNYKLICNEGADYKCWLEDENGVKLPYVINRNTGSSLHTGGWVEGDMSVDVRGNKFYHKLTKKAKNRLEFWYGFPSYRREMDSLLTILHRKMHVKESVKTVR